MASRWYLGESRASELLDYALAQLARRAHLVGPERYLRVKKLLESRIPLWVEERRGPLDTRGYPLYSLKAYKSFIEWWVKLLTAPVGGETTMKGGFVDEVFGRRDPTSRVFGAAATEDEFQVFGIGKVRAAELKTFALNYVMSLVEARKGEPGVMDAVLQIMAAVEKIIDSWMDEKNAPRDPLSGTPYPEIIGPGQLENMRDAMKVMLEELVRTKLYGLPAQRMGLQGQAPWEYYGQTTPAVNVPAVLQKWAGEVGQAGGSPATLGQFTFSELVEQRGDLAELTYRIQKENWTQGWTAEQISAAIAKVLAQWPTTPYAVGAMNAANPQGQIDMARYTMDLGQLKAAVVGQLRSGG